MYMLTEDQSQGAPAEDADGQDRIIMIRQKLDVEQEPSKVIYKKLGSASMQTAISFLLEWTPNMITIYFLGRVGNSDLVAGFGLGLLWSNCFGFGVLTGLACVNQTNYPQGLETMVSQAFGAKKTQLCGKLYNQSLVGTVIMMIPISVANVFSEIVLSRVITDQTMVTNAAIFTQSIIPAIALNGLYQMNKCFLTGQNIYHLQLGAQLASTLVHILWCMLFIQYWGLGLVGCSLARLCTEITSLTVLNIATRCFQTNVSTLRFEMNDLTSSSRFIRRSIPIGALLWLEWMSYEFYSLQASFLSVDAVGANVIMNNFTTLYFQFPYGISIAASTYVGNAIGEGNVKMAKKYAYSSIVLTSLVLLLSQLMLHISKNVFIGLFTSIPSVANELSNSFLLMQILLVLDGFQADLTGIARGIGKEKFSLGSFFFFYLFVGQLTGYYFCFHRGYSLNGVWMGMIMGAGAYNLLLLLCFALSNWYTLARSIQYKLESQGKADNLLLDEE